MFWRKCVGRRFVCLPSSLLALTWQMHFSSPPFTYIIFDFFQNSCINMVGFLLFWSYYIIIWKVVLTKLTYHVPQVACPGAPWSYLRYACQVVTCVRQASRQVEPVVSHESVSCLRCLAPIHALVSLTQAILCRLTPTNSRCKFAARNSGLRHLFFMPWFLASLQSCQQAWRGRGGRLGTNLHGNMDEE